MKRFYKETAVEPAVGGFRVLLDGKPMRTPAKAVLVVPTKPLAEAIAAEWDGVPDKMEINAAHLPLTRLAATGVDRVVPRRAEIVVDTAKYAGSDLLCYRATTPASLVKLQQDAWQPLLDWAASHLGLRFVVTTGLVPVDQELGLVEAARLHIETYDDFTVAGASKLTHGTGSVVLAMAVAEGRITADEAFGLSQIDELWQESLWGADDQAVEFRRALRQDLVDAADFMRLARG